MEDYQIINKDKYTDKENDKNNDEDSTDKSFYSKHYLGHNSENLIIKQKNLKIHFSYYRINGMYFVNINGEHVFDFKRLLLIDWMTNVKNENTDDCNLKIKNANLGEIIIPNCNVKMFEKGIKEIHQWIKKQSNIVKDIYNFVF